MKVRKGFVSNSSSSSFLFIGKELYDKEDVKKELKKYNRVIAITKEENSYGGRDWYDIDDMDDFAEFNKEDYRFFRLGDYDICTKNEGPPSLSSKPKKDEEIYSFEIS